MQSGIPAPGRRSLNLLVEKKKRIVQFVVDEGYVVPGERSEPQSSLMWWVNVIGPLAMTRVSKQTMTWSGMLMMTKQFPLRNCDDDDIGCYGNQWVLAARVTE